MSPVNPARSARVINCGERGRFEGVAEYAKGVTTVVAPQRGCSLLVCPKIRRGSMMNTRLSMLPLGPPRSQGEKFRFGIRDNDQERRKEASQREHRGKLCSMWRQSLVGSRFNHSESPVPPVGPVRARVGGQDADGCLVRQARMSMMIDFAKY